MVVMFTVVMAKIGIPQMKEQKNSANMDVRLSTIQRVEHHCGESTCPNSRQRRSTTRLDRHRFFLLIHGQLKARITCVYQLI
jgi:hypothetical protein